MTLPVVQDARPPSPLLLLQGSPVSLLLCRRSLQQLHHSRSGEGQLHHRVDVQGGGRDTSVPQDPTSPRLHLPDVDPADPVQAGRLLSQPENHRLDHLPELEAEGLVGADHDVTVDVRPVAVGHDARLGRQVPSAERRRRPDPDPAGVECSHLGRGAVGLQLGRVPHDEAHGPGRADRAAALLALQTPPGDLLHLVEGQLRVLGEVLLVRVLQVFGGEGRHQALLS